MKEIIELFNQYKDIERRLTDLSAQISNERFYCVLLAHYPDYPAVIIRENSNTNGWVLFQHGEDDCWNYIKGDIPEQIILEMKKHLNEVTKDGQQER